MLATFCARQRLPGRGQIQRPRQHIDQRRFDQAHASPRGGSPYSRILLRMVRRLTPSSSAAWVRLPAVASRVISSRFFSASRHDSPGFRQGPAGTDGAVVTCSASAVISPPSHRATARRMVLASSRTLPGQEWERSAVRKPRTQHGRRMRRGKQRRKMFRQFDHILTTFPQRRQGERNDIQPIDKDPHEIVLPESSLCSERLVVAMTRSIDQHRTSVSQAVKFALLQNPQQLGLQAAAASPRFRPAARCRHRPAGICRHGWPGRR